MGDRVTARHRSLRVAVALCAAGIVAVCGACSDDDEPAVVKATTAPSSTEATTAPSAAEATTVAPPTAPPVLRSFSTPREAGAALFAAWTGGDRSTAEGLAAPSELDELFAAPPRPDAKDRGCDDGEFGSASCFFGNGQGGVNIAVEPAPAGGWTVTSIDPFG